MQNAFQLDNDYRGYSIEPLMASAISTSLWIILILQDNISSHKNAHFLIASNKYKPPI